MEDKTVMERDRERIEEALRACFQREPERASLYDAMRYSLLAGGKRLRPILVLEACRACGGETERAMPFACAIEMVHTYSLIHDDLPCMDDDDLRRGKPTNHKVFGEAAAVLAGDGLLTAAFEVMTDGTGLPPQRVLEAVRCLSRAAGPAGMVGGQALDLAAEGCDLKLSDLRELHALKTGALITAAVELGAIAAGAEEEERQALRRYAGKLGLAFQIQDDILDVVGQKDLLGKPVGSDRAHEKSTFVSLKGLDYCLEQVEALTGEAVAALAPLEAGERLAELARSLVGRKM